MFFDPLLHRPFLGQRLGLVPGCSSGIALKSGLLVKVKIHPSMGNVPGYLSPLSCTFTQYAEQLLLKSSQERSMYHTKTID